MGISWTRITKASFKRKKEGITMNVIQCYAHNSDNNEDDKDQFYERLQLIIQKCSGKYLTIQMGDLDAKVGVYNSGYEDIMGRDLRNKEEATMEDNRKRD
ncbi:unnamed protein product [Schistosoma curassoni]|uniref:Integrase n=1 Tax=Schistosoma curassoni TaxID=6186 RepID=A0A183K1X3_9TREM|nr:unnamed protein product [Schistosoma curassoni]